MTHIAMQEALDGVNVVWPEKLTDEQYLAGPALPQLLGGINPSYQGDIWQEPKIIVSCHIFSRQRRNACPAIDGRW
jgi:hypothetical protein